MLALIVTAALAASPVRVCAASSLQDVLPKIAPEAVYTFDASSKIAKQARAGAPCDVVIVADVEWAQWLETEAKKPPKLFLSERQTIAGNRLVWVVPATTPPRVLTLPEMAASPPTKLALAGESVPAGRYAEAALKAAGVWSALEKRVVRAENVRAALAWVSRGDADAAIVYVTDALTEAKVRVAFAIDPSLHPKIEYVAFSMSRQQTTPVAARAYLARLRSDEGRQMLRHAGFSF